MAQAQRMEAGSRTPETTRALINPRPMRLGTVMEPNGLRTVSSSTEPGYPLRPGVVLANDTATKVRIQVPAYGTLYLLAKASSATGTGTLDYFPMLADATSDDSVGTRAPTALSLPTQLSLPNTTAAMMTVTLKGEEFAEIVYTIPSGGGATHTVSYIDVFGI